MAFYRTTVIPKDTDLFAVQIRFADGIPAIEVADGVTVQFQPKHTEFAVAYLNDLADKARALALQVAEATS